MSQIGSITVEKEKQMALERQKFQEAKAKMLAQQKYKRAVRTTGHIALNIVVALIVLLPLLYAVSIAFMPSSELFTLDLHILPKHPTLENFRQALQKVPLVRFVINSFLVAGLITFGQIISCSLAAFSFSFLDFKGKNVLFMLVMATAMSLSLPAYLISGFFVSLPIKITLFIIVTVLSAATLPLHILHHQFHCQA